MREIIIIAAMAKNRVIGKDNALPWSLKEDMARFKELTAGWPCIMGRRTWESLPKRPLPGRLNIVVTRTLDAAALAGMGVTAGDTAMVKALPSLSAAIEYCAGREKIFICGGAAVYREALPLANKIELTVIHQNYEGDAFFPEIDSAQWIKTAVRDFDTFSFISYTKKDFSNKET
jgi:dihydrofolate reductase